LRSADSTGDLATAQQDVFGIQSTLVLDLPSFLYIQTLPTMVIETSGIHFTGVQGGLSGIYGAPSLAIPAP